MGTFNEQHDKLRLLLLTLATLVVAVALRLVELDRLPGEFYGDIVIVYEYMGKVLAGDWPYGFVLSNGPLYQYAITPVVLVTGLSYIGLKLASVAMSMLVLGAIYGMGRELTNQKEALLALFIAGVSCWLLIFSRLGNSQILVPLLTAGATIFAARATRRPGRTDIILCALVSALGFYTYPQNFFLPPVMFMTLACLWWLGGGITEDDLVQFVLMTLLCAVPFGLIVLNDPANFFSGYIGEKLPAGRALPGILASNLWRGLLALHVQGDVVFRSNPAGMPHLDPISGVLFLLGVAVWLRPERRRLSVVLFVPLLLLQLPSLLVRYPIQVPSASRTLGVVPMVYLLVASGLWWLLQRLRPLRWPGRMLLLGLLAAIVSLNSYRYFQQYEAGLPGGNTPFNRLIADYIDSLPPTSSIYVVGGAWGLWEQPHPQGILYSVDDPQRVHLLAANDLLCERLQGALRPATVIWSPVDTLLASQLRQCLGAPPPQLFVSPQVGPVFQALELQ